MLKKQKTTQVMNWVHLVTTTKLKLSSYKVADSV